MLNNYKKSLEQSKKNNKYSSSKQKNLSLFHFTDLNNILDFLKRRRTIKFIYMMKNESSSSSSVWQNLRKFYRRNDIVFWSVGLVVFGHLFWWEVQHNQAFVSKSERKHTLGPVTIPYLDEPKSSSSSSSKAQEK